MSVDVATEAQPSPDAVRFYHHALDVLDASGVPFLLGGAYAFGFYTGIGRHTKDLDVFVRPGDVRGALRAFTDAGYRAEVVYTHWLAKAYHEDAFVDIIFNSGNGLCRVDDGWFKHAVPGEVLGRPLSLAPAEEMIWQKAFIMERERFDGADVLHLLRARGRELDWGRLEERFGPHWPVLLAHLALFLFVYPGERGAVPAALVRTIGRALEQEPAADTAVCRGPLLSRSQYLVDIERWGYSDPRMAPNGPLTAEQLAPWIDAGR